MFKKEEIDLMTLNPITKKRKLEVERNRRELKKLEKKLGYDPVHRYFKNVFKSAELM